MGLNIYKARLTDVPSDYNDELPVEGEVAAGNSKTAAMIFTMDRDEIEYEDDDFYGWKVAVEDKDSDIRYFHIWTETHIKEL